MNALIQSFKNAINGLSVALRQERNMQIHMVVAIFVLLLGWVLNFSLKEWALVLLCIGAVISLELINTAIEELCDLVEPNYHSSIRKIKDICAAAVTIVSLVAAIIGSLIFVPHLWK